MAYSREYHPKLGAIEVFQSTQVECMNRQPIQNCKH